MNTTKVSGIAIAAVAASLFVLAPLATAAADSCRHRQVPGWQLLQGPERLQELRPRLQGSELLQGQGLRGDHEG